MAEREEFELRVVESMEPLPARKLERRLEPTAGRVTTPDEALDALKATKGAANVIERVPGLERPGLWQETAYFSVCRKTGTAEGLALWDADHFDPYDMKQNLDNCYAVFTGADDFEEYLGSPMTRTGRVCCFFEAPTRGDYTFNVELETYIALHGGTDYWAAVECFIDDKSFGQLWLDGPIIQPHQAALAAGQHQFQIRQVWGAFIFQSLTVWTIPSVAPTPSPPISPG